MELVLIVLAFLAVSIFTYFNKKNYIKKKIKNTWAKFPKPRLIDDLDQKELTRSMEVMRKYYPEDFYIDAYTWEDLDFIKIFKKISKDYSSVGRDYLFYRLRNFSKDDGELDSLEALVDFFEENEKIRQEAEFNLYNIGKSTSSIPYFIDTRLSKKVKRDRKIYLMGILPLSLLIGSISFFFVNGRLGIIFLGASFLSGLINVSYYVSKSKYMLADIENSAYLGNLLKRSKKFSEIGLPNSQKIDQSLTRLGKISFWLNFIRVEDSEDPFVIMVEGLKKVHLLPLIAYDQVKRQVEDKPMEVLDIFLQVGKIEAAISSLNYKLAEGCDHKPIFTDDFVMEGKNIYHPLVKNPVKNDLDFSKVNIITGSNASGKSTYVKSIAINAIFAQSLNFVLADSFKLKKAGVFTSMAIKDDVVSGDSYFIAEIKSLKRIVDDAKNNKSYYFIDEILKGTNTIERIAASSSVINYLIEKESLAMIASHDMELVSMFGEKIKNIHFREYVKENGDIDFDYKLKEGPSRTRNAIRLLEGLGFDKKIVELAQKRADLLTKEKEGL